MNKSLPLRTSPQKKTLDYLKEKARLYSMKVQQNQLEPSTSYVYKAALC